MQFCSPLSSSPRSPPKPSRQSLLSGLLQRFTHPCTRPCGCWCALLVFAHLCKIISKCSTGPCVRCLPVYMPVGVTTRPCVPYVHGYTLMCRQGISEFVPIHSRKLYLDPFLPCIYLWRLSCSNNNISIK